MGMRTLILALALNAAFGLKVKTEESFGLDQSLDGLPQKLAKIFALSATGKATEEMVDTQLQEFFDAQRALPKERKQKLGKVITDMFPEDSQSLEEVVEWKHTPFAQSLLQQSDPTPPMQRDDWNPYYDDWRERGTGRPTLPGTYSQRVNNGYRMETKLEKNLRLSEEEVARDNCIPDGLLSCFTKDITYLPCRTFNMCMAHFNNMANKQDFYAPHAVNIPRAMKEMRLSKTIWTAGIATCHAANAAQAPWKFAPIKDLVDDAKMGGSELASRLPCTVAYGQNVKVARLGQQLANFEKHKGDVEHKRGPSGGKAVRAQDKKEKELLANFGFELGKETGRWASDPVGEYEKHNMKNGRVSNPEMIVPKVTASNWWVQTEMGKRLDRTNKLIAKDQMDKFQAAANQYKEQTDKATQAAADAAQTPNDDGSSAFAISAMVRENPSALGSNPSAKVQEAWNEAIEQELPEPELVQTPDGMVSYFPGQLKNPEHAFERIDHHVRHGLIRDFKESVKQRKKSFPDLEKGFDNAMKTAQRAVRKAPEAGTHVHPDGSVHYPDGSLEEQPHIHADGSVHDPDGILHVPSKKEVKHGATTSGGPVSNDGGRAHRDADRAQRDFARAQDQAIHIQADQIYHQWDHLQADLIGKSPKEIEKKLTKGLKKGTKEERALAAIDPRSADAIAAGMNVGGAIFQADLAAEAFAASTPVLAPGPDAVLPPPASAAPVSALT